jgi:hypothetical protein
MSSKPGKHNFTIWRGATFRKQLTIKSNGVVWNLTGWTGNLIIRDKPNGTAIFTSMTTENGGMVLGGTTGTVDLIIPASETATFAWNAGVYDLILVSGEGEAWALLYGGFSVKGV